MIKSLWHQLKSSWVPHIFAYTAKWTVSLLLRTCRFQIEGLENLTSSAANSPCIIMLWHNRLAIIADILYRFTPQFTYTAFVSNSRDGKPLSLLVLSYKSGRVLHVSHNGRRNALRQMIARLKERQEIILITPDGPRGPPFIMKPGIVVAARETAAQVIPLSWNADSYWQLPTWDRLVIPKPFSKIQVIFGDPVKVSKQRGKKTEESLSLLQTSLSSIHQFKG